MTIIEWSGLVLTLLSIGGIFLAGIRWYVLLQVQPIAEAINDIRSETKTNGGSSMRDEIRSIRSQQEADRQLTLEHKDKVNHMYEILLEYIARSR